jgi:hypothetical protein
MTLVPPQPTNRRGEVKITEYIAALETIKAEHGDLEVQTLVLGFGRAAASSPRVAYKQVLRGRESKPCFAYEREQDPTRIGAKVCRI